MCSSDTPGSTRATTLLPSRRLPIPIASLCRCPTNSPDRWADKFADNFMVEELEEKSEGLNLQHYLGVVRRRHLHFLIPLFLGWAMVWGASWVLPKRCESTTLILVERPTMPTD